MKSKYLKILIILCLLLSCKDKNSETYAKDSFNTIISGTYFYLKMIPKITVKYSIGNGSYYTYLYVVANPKESIQFNIIKNDSIISPFQATLKIKDVMVMSSKDCGDIENGFSNEEQLKKHLKSDRSESCEDGEGTYDMLLNYTFSEGVWTYKNLNFEPTDKQNAEEIMKLFDTAIKGETEFCISCYGDDAKSPIKDSEILNYNLFGNKFIFSNKLNNKQDKNEKIIADIYSEALNSGF